VSRPLPETGTELPTLYIGAVLAHSAHLECGQFDQEFIEALNGIVSTFSTPVLLPP
jgi:hypothetical protein